MKILRLFQDESKIGHAPRKVQEWQSLVVLEFYNCRDTGPDLELGGSRNLCVLNIRKCFKVKRILSSCDNIGNNALVCRHRTKGCLSHLQIVNLTLLQELEYAPFLRHCGNLQSLQIDYYDPGNYFATNMASERDGCLDVRYLQALHTLIMLAYLWPAKLGARFCSGYQMVDKGTAIEEPHCSIV